MKLFFAMLIFLCCDTLHAQQRANTNFSRRVYEARFMERPPLFSHGKDSLQRFYFAHFPAFDTIIQSAITHGDTAKYIRVYFSFHVDEFGFIYDPAFERVASTQSAVTQSAKTIRYFSSMKSLLDKSIKQMLFKMPAWAPGLEYGQTVNARVEDYIQFWVGLSAPQ